MTRILLDTHALIWWLEGGAKLSPAARLAIANPESTVLVSAASAWEIAIKQQAGKFRMPELVKDFQGRLQQEGFVELPISIEHAVKAGTLPGSHKDPFDRVLIAQAQVENAAMVTRDSLFRKYAVQCIW
ncbi:MAG TPA: type II toxin-antitoxin system VapC family toxin [Candidatus Acidoferrum sp.]|nr:type II toxin-antitoxin system VapC family toxin [Candidatus Acidoferrum sp.]